MVTRAVTNPPTRPPIIQGYMASGAGECARPQVQAEVATTQSSSRPVLLTVPCRVMASPRATWPWKAFSFRAGLEVRNGFAMGNPLKDAARASVLLSTNPAPIGLRVGSMRSFLVVECKYGLGGFQSTCRAPSPPPFL